MTNLHDVILPHVCEVAVAVGGVEAAKERGAFVDVVEADESAEAVQEVGIAQRPEVVPEDGGLVRCLARADVENTDFMSFMAIEKNTLSTIVSPMVDSATGPG
jgi:hypothetical protein